MDITALLYHLRNKVCVSNNAKDCQKSSVSMYVIANIADVRVRFMRICIAIRVVHGPEPGTNSGRNKDIFLEPEWIGIYFI